MNIRSVGLSLVLTIGMLNPTLVVESKEVADSLDSELESSTNFSPISPEGKKNFWTEENLKKLDEKEKKLREQASKVLQPMSINGDVILNTPGYLQELDYYCVPACAQILIEYVTGIKYSQTDLANAMGTSESLPGTGEAGTFVNVAAEQIAILTGAEYELGNNYYQPFYDNMVADINLNFPVIYSVEASIFNTGHSPCGHAVLGNGYGDGNKVWFWDVYPGYGTNWFCDSNEMSEALNANEGYYIY